MWADWNKGLTSTQYDPRLALFSQKSALTMGMGMTEKQGGSDVRANTTQAVPDGDDAWGARYRITGHKWFFSAPMCDAFLVLAQAPGGLTCFFLPRVLPDDTVNAIRIQRLKDKLGNKANASSEVEFDGASAWLDYDLIDACDHPDAGKPERYTGGPCYVGVDIASGRGRDLFVVWVLEQVGDVFWTREVIADNTIGELKCIIIHWTRWWYTNIPVACTTRIILN